MRHVRSETHRLHFPDGELYGGRFVRPFECPERWDHIVAALDEAAFGAPVSPDPVDLDAIGRVHAADYLSFLESAWDDWTAAGFTADAIATTLPTRTLRQTAPEHIDGKLGYYSFAVETAITAGTWKAAAESAAIALTAHRLVVEGDSAAFALCRPPGHHAAADLYGGYCFLNNAAIAAQAFRESGAEKVGVLDVDFHHGNGTQALFYDRADVVFASLHGDPRREFPYFSGYADERGVGEGEGANANYPLAPGTDFAAWAEALDHACTFLVGHGLDALVVSLGVDTFEADPISSFRLGSDDFTTYGSFIGGLGLPTVYVMEGGYAVEEIGVNTVNVLRGHLDATSG